MLKDITLGQFFPGNSLLHKTDARFKILILLALIIGIIAADSSFSFLLMGVVTVTLVLVSKIPIKIILKNLRMLLFIFIFTAVLNVFFYEGETLLWHRSFIEIYKEGLIYALFMILRLACLVCSSFVVLTYTTSPLDMTDAIERLLSPLKKIKVPVHEFAMMMTIALRFIPTLIEETDKIMSAQKARGADMESGGLIKRAKALIPILIPLFVSSFRRADELAEAMECRCYRGGEGRTKMKQIKSCFRDYAFLTVTVGICVAVFFINRYGVRV
ncbi:MAG: energy-coupling factor transporter transmembrane protein EcfT [Clostridia bacterium]|nr:energy-coupling factor transporter transmembrane protein EcfT [Clostridia bacterium]